MHPETSIRLQKFVAQAGIASRRHAEDLIRDGRLTVNGTPARLGDRVNPREDRVALDGRPLRLSVPDHQAYLLYKPRGLVCSRAGVEGKTVFGLFPEDGARLLTAGRLDKDSEGALLLSDNGDWIHQWTHPSFNHAKIYRVTVSGSLRGAVFRQLNDSMSIDGRATRPARVRFVRSGARPGRMILEFVLSEGRNRQIRKMCALTGLKVHRLVRTRIGSLTLGGLKPGQWRALTLAEIRELNRT